MATIAKKSSAAPKSEKSAKPGRKALEKKPPRVISRRYLSPLGKSEIGVRRITAAVKAVRKRAISN